MLRVLRDLFRTNRAFAAGVVLLAFVAGVAAMSFFSPYPPNDSFMVAPDLPPSWPHILGTTSRGQDVFWQLTFAIRNTLLFGFAVALLSRMFSLVIGLVSAVSHPGAVLFRHARPHVMGLAGPGHGLPRLGL
jgi:peptide/nickel transport system permease protein